MSEFLALNYTKHLEQNQTPADMDKLIKISSNPSLAGLLENPEAPESKTLRNLLLPSKSSFQETIFNLGNAISLLKSIWGLTAGFLMDGDARKTILSGIIVRYYIRGAAKILIPFKIPDQISNCSLFFTLLLDVV